MREKTIFKGLAAADMVVWLLCAAAIGIPAATGWTAMYTWDGGGNNNAWTNGDNWIGEAAPASHTNSDLIWIAPGGVQYASEIGVTNDFSLNSLTFNTNVASPATIDPTVSGAVTTRLIFARGVQGNPAIVQNSGQPVAINPVVRPSAPLAIHVPTAGGDVMFANFATAQGFTKSGGGKVAFLCHIYRNGFAGNCLLEDGVVAVSRQPGAGRTIAGTWQIGDGIGAPASAILRLDTNLLFESACNVLADIRGDGLVDVNGTDQSDYASNPLGMRDGAEVRTGTGEINFGTVTVPASSTRRPTIKGVFTLVARTWNIARGSDGSGVDLEVEALPRLTTDFGTMTKSGDGTVLFCATNTTGPYGFRGYLRVNGGRMLVNWVMPSYNHPAGVTTVVVNAGATLGGNAVWDMETDCNFLLDGGRLAPGTNGVGVFTVSDVAAGSVWFDGATTNPSVLAIDLAATNSYDRLRLNGALKLNGRDGSGASRLDVTLLNGFAPASDDRFFIVDNYGTQSVAGAFANAVAAGRVRVASNLTCRISYDGDLASQALTGGNDIVIYDLQVRDPSRTGATLTLR